MVVKHPDYHFNIVGANKGKENVGIFTYGPLLLILGVRSAFVNFQDEVRSVFVDDFVPEELF